MTRKDRATIAQYCRTTAEELLTIADLVSDGEDPGQFSDNISTYGLEAYGALTELLLTDDLIKKDA